MVIDVSNRSTGRAIHASCRVWPSDQGLSAVCVSVSLSRQTTTLDRFDDTIIMMVWRYFIPHDVHPNPTRHLTSSHQPHTKTGQVGPAGAIQPALLRSLVRVHSVRPIQSSSIIRPIIPGAQQQECEAALIGQDGRQGKEPDRSSSHSSSRSSSRSRSRRRRASKENCVSPSSPSSPWTRRSPQCRGTIRWVGPRR